MAVSQLLTRSHPNAPGYQTSVGALRLDAIADPGYENHPAYGLAFPAPGLKLRLQALARLVPWLLFACAKQVFLGDRLPTLPQYPDGLEGGILGRIRALPRYLPFILQTLVAQFSPVKRKAGARTNELESPLTRTLRQDGIVVSRLPDDERTQLNRQLEQPLAEVLRRREHSATTTFKGNQKCFNPQEHGALYASLTSMLSQVGLIDTASAYLNRPVTLTRLVLQVNDARDTFMYTSFPDAGLPNSSTNYMHIDRAYSCLKCVIYLCEVGPLNGPFSYVLGSNRLDNGALGGVVRRAVDRAGLSASDRDTRQVFMALPKSFRKKGLFGADMIDHSANSNLLLRAEYCFTSDFGNVALFDNLGIHRGGLVSQGQRRALFATLA